MSVCICSVNVKLSAEDDLFVNIVIQSYISFPLDLTFLKSPGRGDELSFKKGVYLLLNFCLQKNAQVDYKSK